MSEELKFQKLSEVEFLEEAPAGSRPLVEHEGKIKRVAGGLGGAGIPVFDLTPYIAEDGSNVNLDALNDGILIITPEFTDKEVEAIMELAASGAILFHVDSSAMQLGFAFTINHVYSTQYIDTSEIPDADFTLKGVALYNSIVDLYMLSDIPDLMSAVGYVNGEPMARFVFPFMPLVVLSGL